MADKKISALPSATANTAAEIPVNEGGVTKKVSMTAGGATVIEAVSAAKRTITMGVRVNAGVVPTGAAYANIPLAVTGTITAWRMVASPAATVTVDVWKRAGALPTVAQTICNTGGGGVKPALAAAAVGSGNVANWTPVAVAAGDIIEMNVDANDLAQQIALVLEMTVS